MAAISPCSQPEALRIAIALVALRYKPADQAYKSYVLDLQAKFPISSNVDEVTLQWRRRALTLEEELQTLKTKTDAEQVELAALRSKVGEGNSQPPPTPTSPPGNKKKSKKKTTKTQGAAAVEPKIIKTVEELKAKMKILSGYELPEGNLLASFEQLNTILLKKHTDIGLVCAAAHRALESITVSLKPILQCPTTNNALNTNTGLLKAATVLIPRLLSSVLPLFDLNRDKLKLSDDELSSALGHLLRQFMDSLIYPLLASFYSLSRNFLTALLSRTEPKISISSPPSRSIVDFRPQIFALLQVLVESLRTTYVNADSPNRISSDQIKDLFELMTLRTVRELDNLYSDHPNTLGTPFTSSRSVFNSTRTDHMSAENLGETAPWVSSTPDRSGPRPRGGGGGGITNGGVHSTLGLGTNSSPDIASADQEWEQLGNTDRRVLKLARKDAMWYLCNVVHLMFCEMDEIDVSNERDVVNEVARRNQMDRDHNDRDRIRDQHGQHQPHHRHQDDTLPMGSLGTSTSIKGTNPIDPSSFTPSLPGPSEFSEPHRQDYRHHQNTSGDQDQDNPRAMTSNDANGPDDRNDPSCSTHDSNGANAHDFCPDRNELERNLTGLLGEAVIVTMSGLLRRTCVSTVAVRHTTSSEEECEGYDEGNEGKESMVEEMSVLRKRGDMSTSSSWERMDEVESRMVMALVERAWLRMS
ncbi:hypothetical protein QCA50_008619 [Cerrena zonata]|uniref:Uncharacterized protein n=1 Tax=Cerrena zonata TaxID=2478898 RepID=A0AAW0GA74_9APHY